MSRYNVPETTDLVPISFRDLNIKKVLVMSLLNFQYRPFYSFPVIWTRSKTFS